MLPYILLLLLIGLPVLALAALSWRAGGRLLTSPEVYQPVMEDHVVRYIGGFLVWLGTVILLGMAMLGISLALNTVSSVALPATAGFLAVIAVITLLCTIRTFYVNPGVLGPRPRLPHPEVQSTSFSREPIYWLTSPLGISLSLSILCVCFTTLQQAALAQVGFSREDAPCLPLLLLAAGCELVIFVAYSLTAAGAILTTPQEEGTLPRLAIAALLRWFAAILVILLTLSMLWLGVLVAITLALLLIASRGGRRRASQLTAFWTFTNVVDSDRPLDLELRQQAEILGGRTGRLLYRTAQDLEAGADWSQSVYAREVVPRGAWMEVASARRNGMLAVALQEAAARETRRFSRQSDPTSSRIVLGYVGIVCAVFVMMASFTNYYIMPKFKKIFEDFDTELPAISQFWLGLTTEGSGPLFLFTFSLLFFSAMMMGELVVSYHGWFNAVERWLSRWYIRGRTPDLLRGLRWAVIREQPIEQALEVMAEPPLGFFVRSRLHQTATAIRDGQDAWDVLRQMRWISRAETDLLQSAQVVGNLPWAMETLADSIVARFEYRVEWWLQVLHPVFILLIGSYVALFALAVMIPLFKLINDLS